MAELTLTLFSAGLLSKWGFNDGDMPDGLWDYFDEKGMQVMDWHPVLIHLVRGFLAPKIEQNIELVEICTGHNPIRVTRLYGLDVSDAWYSTSNRMWLTPEFVNVPFAEVERAARELGELYTPPQ